MNIIEHLIERIEALENSKVFDSLTYATAQQVAWSRGRESVTASDYVKAVELVKGFNSRRSKPFDEHKEGQIMSLTEIEGDENDV